MQGEASRNDLERTSSLSILWRCLSKVADSINVQKFFVLDNLDLSNVTEDISRFLGAFISSSEVIIDASSDGSDIGNRNIINVIDTLEKIFVPTHQQNRKADIIVQLIKEYKDWFNYCYMFNRRTGKHPRSALDIINHHYQSHKPDNGIDSSIPGESDEDIYKDEEDHLGDSFAHENFPSLSAPNVAPLNPFSSETYVLPPMNPISRELSYPSDDNLVKNSSEVNEIPFAPDEASIINSYYTNWSHVVEEDEDSDADPTYFVSRNINKRVTRLKSLSRDNSLRGVNHKKKEKRLTRRRSNSDPPVDPNSSRLGKSVTFADQHHLQLNSSEEFDSRNVLRMEDSAGEEFDRSEGNINDLVSPTQKNIEKKGKRFIFSSVEVNSSNDMVEGFDSAEDSSPLKAVDFLNRGSAQNGRDRGNSDSSLELSDHERTRRFSENRTDANDLRNGYDSALVDPGNIDKKHAKEVSRSISKRDPWLANYATQRYRNPLDASVEESKIQEIKSMLSSSISDSNNQTRFESMPVSDLNHQISSSQYESLDGSSIDKNSILSPSVKIPSIQSSPHRYAGFDVGSDSDSAPFSPGSRSSSMSTKSTNPGRQETLNRLKQSFVRMQETKKNNYNPDNLSTASPTKYQSKFSQKAIFDHGSLFGSNDGISSPQLSPSKARQYNHRSSPSKISLSSLPAATIPLRKGVQSGTLNSAIGDKIKMPMQLILEKKPVSIIRNEVFTLVQGRRRTLTVPSNLVEGEDSIDLKTSYPRSVVGMSLDLPLLQTQSNNLLLRDQMISIENRSLVSIQNSSFQVVPSPVDLPDLSEVALETGVIMEGFLKKKSSTFGIWQQVSNIAVSTICGKCIIFVIELLYSERI